jgi:hypothetical protein
MSLRTMPDRASAFAMPLPLLLVPSPGYGPPVSSGMTEQVPFVVVVVGAATATALLRLAGVP